jgi:SAM-dependent MidA family methyltransferase
VPDGSCDISAYVAIDAVAAAGASVAGAEPAVVSQRAALRALGVDARRPPHGRAREDPAGYVRALATASAAAELTDPEGLGGHWWIVQPVGLDPSVRRVVIPEVFSTA